MRPRIALSRVLIRVGEFLESLAAPLMRPDDLMEFTRRYYASARIVNFYAGKGVTEAGLYPCEKAMMDHLPLKSGRMLVLCVGGGREAMAMAQMGFEVTGVDHIPEILERARAKAAERGLRFEGQVQEMSRLDLPVRAYDAAWLSAMMYSSIPTRARRIRMLRRVARALKPQGYFLCQFFCDPGAGGRRAGYMLRKAVAALSLGNTEYERGDTLLANTQFMHVFLSPDEARSEFVEGGFEVITILADDELKASGAVLRKTSRQER